MCAWSKLGGGDHEGENWTPTGDTISGVHSNIGTLTISGTTTLNQGALLELYANAIVISGTLDGEGKGYSGGTGPGAGQSGFSNFKGAGGGAYGGDGGDGNDRDGGVAYGDNTTAVIQMGSAGGNMDNSTGGYGGGGVILCANDITITGTINMDAIDPTAGSSGDAGGGGAGGGILIICGGLICTASTMTCHGTDGFTSGAAQSGGGGGGRAKFWYVDTDVDPLGKVTETPGAAGGAGAGAGTIGEEVKTTYIERLISTNTLGQTFNFNVAGAPTLTKIDLYVESVASAGSVALVVYNDTGKGVNYGSVAININSTGVKTFTFATPLELPDGLISYYFELSTSIANVDFGLSAGNKYASGDYHLNGAVIHGLDAYMKIYLYTHMYSPQVYNISDKSIKCNVANTILTGAEHRINANGAGHIRYVDDFTTSKYLGDRAVMENISYDAINDYIYCTSPGYIYYKIDTKYPIVDTPTLDALIYWYTTEATIQIAKEVDGLPNLWYDINDPVVTGVLTEYNLECDDLTFEGETILYFRINIPATGSIRSIELDIDMDTTSAQVPMVDVVGDSTFRCDQGAGSDVDGLVTLFYNDAMWGGV